MKFKLFGFQFNTLYIILLLLVFLAICYFGLTMVGKEGFSRSVKIVTSLLGDDYNNLPSDDQINKAIGETYDTRFTEPLKNAVYALYKMTLGLPLIMDKLSDIQKAKDQQQIGDAMQKKSTDGFDVMSDCNEAVAELEASLSSTIDKIIKVKGPLCGQKLYGQVGLARFEASYKKLKLCKEKVVTLLNDKTLLEDISEYKDFYDFVIQYFNDVSVYLDKFVSELKENGECPQPDASTAVTKSVNADGSICTTKCDGSGSSDPTLGTPIGPNTTSASACGKASSAGYSALSTQQDNYNHFSKTSVPALFYGADGNIAKVQNTNGKFSIITTDKMGTTKVYHDNVPVTQVPKPEPERNVYYGPQKTRAVFFTDDDGSKSIRVMFGDGTQETYSEVNTEAFTNQSESRMESSLPPDQVQPREVVLVEDVSTPADYNQVYSLSLTSDNTQNSLPKGIPRYMIPPGQEDLYILKSEVVPPVCPACPAPIVSCDEGGANGKDCPPCPPCGACPEPDFTCKKVPNYGQGNKGSSYNNPVGEMGNGTAAGASNVTKPLPSPEVDGYTTYGM